MRFSKITGRTRNTFLSSFSQTCAHTRRGVRVGSRSSAEQRGRRPVRERVCPLHRDTLARRHGAHTNCTGTRVRGRRDSRKNHNAAPGNRYLSRATLLGDGCVGGPDLCITRADDMRHARSRAPGLPNLSPRPVCGTLDFQRPGNACFLLLASDARGRRPSAAGTHPRAVRGRPAPQRARRPGQPTPTSCLM